MPCSFVDSLMKWRHIVNTVQGFARYVCMPDNLRVGLASILAQPAKDEGPLVCPLSKPAVMVKHEPMRVFISADRFLLSPLPLGICAAR